MLEAGEVLRQRMARRSPLFPALMLVLVITTFGGVYLVVTRRFGLTAAIAITLAPWGLLAAVVRPDWVLLTLLAMPATVTAAIRPNAMLLVAVVTLVALLVTRKTFSLGLWTGLAALMIINLAARIVHADVGPEALSINDNTMLVLSYHLLLALLALNLAKLGELDAERLSVAFVIGVVTTLLLGIVGYGGAWFESGPGIITRTYLGPLAAAAFGIAFARLLMSDERSGRLRDYMLAAGLLVLTLASLSRAPWIAATITLIVLVMNLRGRRYAVLLVALLALLLFTPSARQEITRSESGDVLAALQTGEISTGRFTLWGELWERGTRALPWGNGFGYVWSLTSTDLFGAPGLFAHEESGVVPPHNDFVYLFVEFGIPGLLLFALFWIGLFRAHRLTAKSVDPLVRRSGWLLVGVSITGLVFCLFDDLFAVRPVAERFFPIAGFMFGLGQLERMAAKDNIADTYTGLPTE